MPKIDAFIFADYRGINVSGHHLIKMNTLLELCHSLGFEKSKSYIQSGNIIFQYKATPCKTLEKLVAEKISSQLGLEVACFVIEKEDLEIQIKDNPFYDNAPDLKSLYAVFLSEIPDIELITKISPELYEPDQFHIMKNIIYLYCPKGYGNTKINNTFFEKKLHLKATTRNWKTVNMLLEMAKLL